jgi:hypothetical protein
MWVDEYSNIIIYLNKRMNLRIFNSFQLQMKLLKKFYFLFMIKIKVAINYIKIFKINAGQKNK